MFADFGRIAVDGVEADKREIALVVFRHAHAAFDGVAGVQIEAADLRGRNINIVKLNFRQLEAGCQIFKSNTKAVTWSYPSIRLRLEVTWQPQSYYQKSEYLPNFRRPSARTASASCRRLPLHNLQPAKYATVRPKTTPKTVHRKSARA